jgi:DNA-directed RNA polymerase subunit RPC12/RpoP
LSGFVCESCSAEFDCPVDTVDGLDACPECGSLCVLHVDDEEVFDYEEAIRF